MQEPLAPTGGMAGLGLSTGQAARLLGVTEPRLADLVRRGKVVPAPAIVAGRRVWIAEQLLAVGDYLGLDRIDLQERILAAGDVDAGSEIVRRTDLVVDQGMGTVGQRLRMRELPQLHRAQPDGDQLGADRAVSQIHTRVPVCPTSMDRRSADPHESGVKQPRGPVQCSPASEPTTVTDMPTPRRSVRAVEATAATQEASAPRGGQ